MKGRSLIGILTLAVFVGACAGVAVAKEDNPFERFIKPVSNPVYFDDARNQTYIHIVHAHQNLPSEINTILGDVPLDGDLSVTALRVNFAVNERFSIIAAKDGYIDFNPDETLDDEEGWGDIAAGVKYAFIYDPENEFILSGKLLYEFTQGSREVFQGNGEGNFAPAISFLKGFGKLQLAGTVGGIIPVDGDAESTVMYDSWHVSYAVTPTFFPLIELNHFWVVDEGRRDELVSSIVEFEGGDLINMGARHSERSKHFVSLALGMRSRLMKNLDFGIAYEFPLTDDEDSLMKDRFTFDLIFHF